MDHLNKLYTRALNKFVKKFNRIQFLGSDKPHLSCIRITAMLIASNRLWIGTGIGVVLSVPLLDSKYKY